MTDLMLAKEELSRHTLALAKDGEVITSDKRGVAPMVDFLREGKSFSGFFAAGKVMGKAAALLFITAGVKEVFGETVAPSAIELFESCRVRVSYNTLVPYIINRDKTGMCPMESAVFSVSDVETGVKLIFEKLDKMREARNQRG